VSAHAEFSVGFNQAWLKNNYARSWTDGWDEDEARTILRLTAKAGGTVLRMWIFEGLIPGGVAWNNDVAVALDPRVPRNLDRFLTLAREEGVKVAFALFNGNMVAEMKIENKHLRGRWINLLHEQDGAGVAFRKNVLRPVLDVLRRHEESIELIDLVNEADALFGKGFKENILDHGWDTVNAFACRWRDFIRNEGLETPVTVSLGWPGLFPFWPAAVDQLLEGRLKTSCVDVFVLHLYNDRGEIPHCKKIAEFRQSTGKKLFLGEFGQSQLNKRYSDSGQTRLTENFIPNARRCGMDGAWAWRLKDERPGDNSEARFSYWTFGGPRPALEAFRRCAAEPDIRRPNPRRPEQDSAKLAE